MVVVPALSADTNPVEVTLATELLLLFQVPNGVASLSEVVVVIQRLDEPTIAAGEGVTVIACVAAVPQPVLYVIVTAPPTRPLTTPVAAPTVAIAVLLLLHVPPLTASDNVVLLVAQKLVAPVIDAGTGIIVTVIVV